MNSRPQSRPSLSLIAGLPYCVWCLCGQDHSIPDCPPPSPQQPAHPHVCNLYTTYDDDSAEDPAPTPQFSRSTPREPCTGMYGTAKTHGIPSLLQPLPNLQPRPSLPLVPPHANSATLRHLANVIAPSSIHPSPSSPNFSPPSLPHLYPLYPPLLLIAKSHWIQGLPWTHTTRPTLPTRQL